MKKYKPKEYINKFGVEKATEVAIQAGTTYQYLNQVALGFRNASPKLAKRLIEASGGRIDFEALVLAREARDG